MLIIEGISKHFNGRPAVLDFNLTVPENGFTVLIGPSGCGKSTLFDLLMGALPMEAGRICWRDAVVPDLRRLAAYMQQSDLLLPWLGLADNARLPADIAGAPVDHTRHRIRGLFDRLGLAGLFLVGVDKNCLQQQLIAEKLQACRWSSLSSIAIETDGWRHGRSRHFEGHSSGRFLVAAVPNK